MARFRIIRDDEDPYYELESTNNLQEAIDRKSEGNHQFISRYYYIWDTELNREVISTEEPYKSMLGR